MDEPLYPAAQGQQRQAEEQRYGPAERPSRPASWPDSGKSIRQSLQRPHTLASRHPKIMACPHVFLTC